MLVIGLTGGIASGKTTISNLFSELGVAIVDTDVVSRQLLEKAQPGYQRIYEEFGDKYFEKDGNINRAKLRQAVFNDPDLKTWLEAMLHPLIYNLSKQQLENQTLSSYAMLVVPLMFETSFDTLADRVLVVDCTRETQLNRLLARDNIDESLATKMLDQQLSNDERLSKADDIIHNDQGDDLAAQIRTLHQLYLTISA